MGVAELSSSHIPKQTKKTQQKWVGIGKCGVPCMGNGGDMKFIYS